MTRKRRRLLIVLAGMSCLGVAAALMLNAFGGNLVFFYSPSELKDHHVTAGQRLRIGGLVEEKSVVREADGLTITFRVTDLSNAVPVSYRGILPDLFREGQGVVAEGRMGDDGVFQANNILAKHDEKYMPPEVAEALKKSGQWNEGQTGAPAVGAAKGANP
jgi:cytochrome c-type biogenesis protein CcmE